MMLKTLATVLLVVSFVGLIGCGDKSTSQKDDALRGMDLSIPSPFFEEEFPEMGASLAQTDPMERELREVRSFVGGVVKSTITSYDDASRRIAFSPYSTRFYLVGRVNSDNAYNHDFMLSRFLPDGTLDNDFSSDGVDVLDLQGTNEYEIAHAIAVQTDGKVVIGGKAWNGSNHDWGLARYLTDGTLDNDWSSDGKLTHTISSNGTEILRGLYFQTDGEIAAAGYAYNGTDYDFALVRYTTNGNIDSDFGIETTAITTNKDDCATAVAVSSNGHLIVVGATQDTTDWDLASVRYNTDGSLHTGYGSSGKKVHDTNSGGDDIFWDVALDSSVRIVGVGQSAAEVGSGTDVVVVRYNTNGSTDNNFGSSGVKVWSWTGSTNNEVGRSIAIQKNGKIVITGDRDDDFAVARLLTNGELDTTFSSDGMNTTTIGSGVDVATGVAVSGNGYILSAGRYHNGTNLDLAVARWDITGAKISEGALDKLFNSTGKLTQSANISANSWDSATGGVATYSDGTIIAAGECGSVDTDQDFCVMRIKPDGTLDANFGNDGIRQLSFSPGYPGPDAAYGVAIQSDGKIVVGGKYEDNGIDGGYALARFLTNGDLDTTFDGDGYKTDAYSYFWPKAMHLQTDGKIILAGSDTTTDMVAKRFNTDGSTDANFNAIIDSGGDDVANSAITMTNGKVVLAGFSNDGTYFSSTDFSVALLLTNGSLDTTFGDAGFKTHTYMNDGVDILYSVTLQRDGKIVAGGQGKRTGGDDVVVVRYLTSGDLDTSFDTDGLKGFDPTDSATNTKARAVYALPNYKILAAGSEEPGEVFVVRLHSNGSLDTTFDTDGVFVNSFHGTPNGNIYGLTVASDGRIIIAGGDKDATSTDHEFAIMTIWP